LRASIAAPWARKSSTSGACPARAARASAMAPSRSRASSEAPAASSSRASGTQPESAAAISARFNCVEVASALVCSNRRSSSRHEGGPATGAGAAAAAFANTQAASKAVGMRRWLLMVSCAGRSSWIGPLPSLSDRGGPM
jgi:hypothetical protein